LCCVGGHVALLSLLRAYARQAFYFFRAFYVFSAGHESAISPAFLRQHPLVDKLSEVLFLGCCHLAYSAAFEGR